MARLPIDNPLAIGTHTLEVNLPGSPLASAARPGSVSRRAVGAGGPQS